MKRDGCAWCGSPFPPGKRSHARTFSQRCRQALQRFEREIPPGRGRPEAPLRLAYADPPYPGRAGLYLGHPDYGGEVDHVELVARLQGYDGWALSTSSEALPELVGIASSAGVAFRVAAWIRGPRPGRRAWWPLSSWEPVLYRPARTLPRERPPCDSLVYTARPRLTDPGRVVGAKPARFARWLFDLLAARPGDTFHDLYPGSGGIRRAWERFELGTELELADDDEGHQEGQGTALEPV